LDVKAGGIRSTFNNIGETVKKLSAKFMKLISSFMPEMNSAKVDFATQSKSNMAGNTFMEISNNPQQKPPTGKLPDGPKELKEMTAKQNQVAPQPHHPTGKLPGGPQQLKEMTAKQNQVVPEETIANTGNGPSVQDSPLQNSSFDIKMAEFRDRIGDPRDSDASLGDDIDGLTDRESSVSSVDSFDSSVQSTNMNSQNDLFNSQMEEFRDIIGDPRDSDSDDPPDLDFSEFTDPGLNVVSPPGNKQTDPGLNVDSRAGNNQVDSPFEQSKAEASMKTGDSGEVSEVQQEPDGVSTTESLITKYSNDIPADVGKNLKAKLEKYTTQDKEKPGYNRNKFKSSALQAEKSPELPNPGLSKTIKGAFMFGKVLPKLNGPENRADVLAKLLHNDGEGLNFLQDNVNDSQTTLRGKASTPKLKQEAADKLLTKLFSGKDLDKSDAELLLELGAKSKQFG
jgi:hypothetical protein